MDDHEHVCPLCCEELDISDREFYPCKCGYQVCMWCWHRIRESESGLCPACRTPYGEDPHQFSAVDVEEVLKLQKEKMEDKNNPANIVKDRSQLANMRVIRRNLVYAVGLPPMSEDTLRKPEYFGQYGKISKIVLNRAVAGERRATASAYVTFLHKEDTLSCILALDGFYWENRNIRASYGTSKYCSAFIKSVRCNNPECTYLHEMGEPEDTFTKQEIQAGYVTSGRDVLARQQQIVSEQLRQGSHSGVRKRVGGGGPSGTGRACANPVFPPPEYDEPAKPAPTLVPPPVGVTRAASTAVAPALNPANIAAKLGRSSSVGRPAGKSAASIVAGVHTTKEDSAAAAAPHTTLTPLTPLKRTTTTKAKNIPSMPTAPPPPQQPTTQTPSEEQKLPPLRVAAKPPKGGAAPVVATRNAPPPGTTIGGDVIAPGGTTTAAAAAAAAATARNSSALGGEIFTGQLSNKPIGRGAEDKWSVAGAPLPGLWNNNNSSSSALASILGVNLPTESPLQSLNQGSSLIGGVPLTTSAPIGGRNHHHHNSTSGSNNNNNPGMSSNSSSGNNYHGKSDIALLQSLLPGVHITSGSDSSNNNWKPVGGETLPGWGAIGPRHGTVTSNPNGTIGGTATAAAIGPTGGGVGGTRTGMSSHEKRSDGIW